MNVGIIGLGRLGEALARGLDRFWKKGAVFGFNRSADRLVIAGVLGAVGAVHELPREEIPYYSALASCGPALYAVMMEEFADALSARRGYDRELCRTMVKETMAGTIARLDADGLDARSLVERVAHPGGPSEAGSNFLRGRLPDLYRKMLTWLWKRRIRGGKRSDYQCLNRLRKAIYWERNSTFVFTRSSISGRRCSRV
jgi:pyrroline-5-carboxylate reductase